MSTEFVHLHVHTEYSLLDGLARVPQLVGQAKKMGMPALAVTDHGAMYAAIEHYQAAKEAGLRPIVGCEVYVAPGSRLDRTKSEGSAHHLVLLATNEQGYRNLVQLVTAGHLEGFYYKPRVDRELLERHHEGLIAMSACPSGELGRAILAGDLAGARETADWYHQVCGKGNYYLELQRHELPELKTIGPELVKMSREMGIPLVATNDVHYVNREDAYAQEILLCIQTNSTMEDPKRMRMEADTFYLRSPEEMAELFSDLPEAVRNTLAIAERCDLQLDFGRVLLPQFEIPAGYTPETWLEKKCVEGMRRRYPQVTPEIEQRLRYELSVIGETGFATYILIVADFVEHARESGILFGPRGSAAGAVVCYCLGISDVDPVANKLVFERFLNVERKEMPDIDMDFADDQRDEMIAYATQKYGRDHVAQIITFGTLGAKAAIRDVGRVLGMPVADADRVAKLIPPLPVGITIDQAMEKNPQLREIYEADDSIRRLVDTAKTVEGVARHASTHAAGVVISRDPLINYAPLQRCSRDEQAVMSQYPMETLAQVGLLKMDFLGLANLTILGRTVKLIRETRGQEIALDKIPLDDPKVFEMLGAGETTGIFQLEGSGMRRYIKELKPTSVSDLAAMVALYRPGPMEFIPKFIRSKAGLEPITYPHPRLEPILKDTYGVLVYQDQVLHMVQAVAGYSLGHADILRKAMGKKVPEIMRQERANFVEGAKGQGLTEEEATKVFDIIEPFAGYAFNKSHAFCYASVAYQTAYFKANYPVEYMCAVLNTAMGNMDKVTIAAVECRRLGLELLPPDVNESDVGFTVQGQKGIRFGLGAIKNVGSGPSEAIVAARRAGGEFRSIDDFCERVDPRLVNKRVVESLIKASALDPLGNRSQLLQVLDRILGEVQRMQKASMNGQTNLFDLLGDHSLKAIELPGVPDFPDQTKLIWEKEMLGTFFTEHPLNKAVARLRRVVTAFCGQIGSDLVGQKVTVAGVVTNPRPVITRKGDMMLMGTLDDLEGTIDIVVFPRTYQQTKDVWREDAIVVVSGKVDSRDERLQIVVDTAELYVDREEEAADDSYVPLDGLDAPAESRVLLDEPLPDEPIDEFDDLGSRGEESPAADGVRNAGPALSVVPAADEAPSPAQENAVAGSDNGHGAGDGNETNAVASSLPSVLVRSGGPPSVRVHLYVHRSDDERRDLALFHEALLLVGRHKGSDPVDVTILTADGRAIELDFPNLATHYSRHLESQLADLLSPAGISVERVPGPEMAEVSA